MIPTAEAITTRIHTDPVFRKTVCMRHHYWFFMTYFTGYLKFPCADMHKQMLYFSQMINTRQMLVLGFPRCGKTLIHSYSLPLWSMLTGSAKNLIIVVGNIKEKRQFCQHFEQMLLFRQELKRDFPFRYQKRGWYFFFPELQAQIYIASLEEKDQFENVLGQTPDLIVVDPIERFRPDDRATAERLLFSLLDQVGNEDTRKIIVGRSDGKDGPMRHTADRLLQREDLQYKTVFYPFFSLEGEALIPAWKGKFYHQQAIDEEMQKATREEFFLEYWLFEEVPEYPLTLSEQCCTSTYPTSIAEWSNVDDGIKKDIAGLFFAPYHGEEGTASILWGVETNKRSYIFQGRLWEGASEDFDADGFFMNIRSQLDQAEPPPKMLFYGDKQDPFGQMLCAHKFPFRNFTVLCPSRHERPLLKKTLAQAIASGRIQFHRSFANTVEAIFAGGDQGAQRLIHQLSLPLGETSPEKVLFTINY